MKARIILALTIVLLSVSSLLVLWQAHAVPTNQGQQLFFDDFTSSQFSPNWNRVCVPDCRDNGNLTQAGGWLSIVSPRSAYSACGGCVVGANILSNNTEPIISSTTKTQFVYMVWKMVPFNLTQVGNNAGSSSASRNSAAIFGLFNGVPCIMGPCGPTGWGIGFQLQEVDSVGSAMMLGKVNQRETVGILISNLMTTGQSGPFLNQCFVNNGPGGGMMLGERWPRLCDVNKGAIIYSNPSQPIDLNGVHVFTMEAYFDSINHNSWAAFSVDSNAWLNVTQTACNCFDLFGGSYRSLWPYINSQYCIGTVNATCANTAPNQSLSTQIDYILVNNYVPSSLPAGQAVPNPGISGQIGPQGLRSTFPNYLVALAYELGKGIPLGSSQFLMSQVQFGGFLLFLITIMVITVPGVILHVRNPMIYSFLAFIISIIYFGLGVLALWFFGSIVLLFLGIMVGTVPASLRHTGGGGEVE